MATPNVPVDGAKREQAAPQQASQQPAQPSQPAQQPAQQQATPQPTPAPDAKQTESKATTAGVQPAKEGMDPKPTSDVAQTPANETKNISSPDAAKALSSTTMAAESKTGEASEDRMKMSEKMSQSEEQDAEDEAQRLKEERENEQTDSQRLEQSITKANSENSLFYQIAEENKVYADQSRDEHRMMRLREDAEKVGDPTRDAAAKQAVMDQNTKQEGALEEATRMSAGKSDKA